MRFDVERNRLYIGPHHLTPKFHIFEEFEYPSGTFLGEELTSITRVTRTYFENRWALSILWGSMTYSDNYNHPYGSLLCADGEYKRVRSEFIEEPVMVEVGIIMPFTKVKPAYTIHLPAIGNLPERSETIPEHEYELWGDPLGYVDAEELWHVVERVRTFDSDGEPEPEDGPYLEPIEEGGPRRLVWVPRVEA